MMESVTEANLDESADVDQPEVTESEVGFEPHPGSQPGYDVESRRGRRRIDKKLLAVSVVIAVGIVLVGIGLASGITGEDRVKLPEQVEDVEPVPEAVQVLSQTRVFVDLIDDHTGVLVIDGIELPTVDIGEVSSQQNVEPGQQVSVPAATIFEAGNATLTFIPSDEALIAEFDSGLHDATVIYWKVDEGRQFARSFSWTFNVV